MNLINELNSAEKKELRGLILKEINNNEKEYCFDKSYTSDIDWILRHGKETRYEAYRKATVWHNSLSLEEILKEYDGGFDYIVEKYIDEKNNIKKALELIRVELNEMCENIALMNDKPNNSLVYRFNKLTTIDLELQELLKWNKKNKDVGKNGKSIQKF